ncbi:TlpA disulfide reductase family protein [Nocardioides cavernaquae]|uniref:TlpA family protein disulfide reductase n=1 Tax=Nocardioides cavernaquae TaxID=2321396 RepID=A0A3A5H611_9ACTN|nr:TlpA disulfide reductase family protein [Nocardioides cavernaquae]RJS46119.1 TlpA family protein disulfide reductase [Nocardioides cavernaquae]
MIHRRCRGAVALATLVALTALLTLTGCSGFADTGGKGYVSGNGQVTEIAAADRAEPVEISGTTLDGDELDLADFRGAVVVVNLWGSWCAECRVEAPDLVAVDAAYDDKAVQFVGINVREPSRDNALAYERTFDITYPSFDDQGGATLLALRGTVPPNAIPSTLVLDTEGRIAARILGELPSQVTLKDLIEGAGGPRV